MIQVSSQSKQFLALMSSRPLLKIEKLNPALFKFVVELREVKVRFTINNEVEIQVCQNA